MGSTVYGNVLNQIKTRQPLSESVELFTSKVSDFLRLYFIAESFVKEISSTAIHRDNITELKKFLSKHIGVVLSDEIVDKVCDSLDSTKFSGYDEKNDRVDIRTIKKHIDPQQYSHEHISLLFSSEPVKIGNESRKSARQLRNEIVHKIKSAALKEVETRYDELIALLNGFIILFTK